MATYLELCQAVARDSGTVPKLGDPASVSGQTGRLARIVYWTREAWLDIQRSRRDWLWMEADFEGTTTAGNRFYAGSDFGLTRFSSWVWYNDPDANFLTMYDPVAGQGTEAFLTHWPFETFRRRAMVGTANSETGAPTAYTINPDGRIGFYKIPDKGYVIRGRYRKSAQVLTANTDVPDMPADYHDAIRWRALILMANFDEAVEQQPAWASEFARIMGFLVQHQTPAIEMGGALA